MHFPVKAIGRCHVTISFYLYIIAFIQRLRFSLCKCICSLKQYIIPTVFVNKAAVHMASRVSLALRTGVLSLDFPETFIV